MLTQAANPGTTAGTLLISVLQDVALTVGTRAAQPCLVVRLRQCIHAWRWPAPILRTHV